MRRHRLPALVPMPEVREYSKPVESRAYELLTYLETHPFGTDAHTICDALAWTRGQFDGALGCARNLICPQIDLAIPHPVPDDGWRYRLTGQWLSDDGSPAIAAGTGHAVGQIEARLRSVLRDARVARTQLDPQSLDGRKVNALTMHLAHVLAVIAEISADPKEAAS